VTNHAPQLCLGPGYATSATRAAIDIIVLHIPLSTTV
jgi:hypothetical protein